MSVMLNYFSAHHLCINLLLNSLPESYHSFSTAVISQVMWQQGCSPVIFVSLLGTSQVHSPITTISTWPKYFLAVPANQCHLSVFLLCNIQCKNTLFKTLQVLQHCVSSNIAWCQWLNRILLVSRFVVKRISKLHPCQNHIPICEPCQCQN